MKQAVISANVSGKMQLFTVLEDGSNSIGITDGTHDCAMPSWSPNGQKIAFVRNGDTENELWLCNPDGSNQQKLLGASQIGGATLFNPSWLPDSTYIVWYGVPATGNSKLYLLNTVNKQFRLLFSDPTASSFSNMMPTVSPDGTKVAYATTRMFGSYRIWVSNLDGTAAKAVSPMAITTDPTTGLPITQKVPVWSPDGLWIAHWEGVEQSYLTGNPAKDANIAATWHVWTVGRDGLNKSLVGQGDDPVWSSDGLITRALAGSGTKLMIQVPLWRSLPILPPSVKFGRFAWNPLS